MVKKELNIIVNEVNLQDKNLLWDFIKCQIRSKTISYSKYIAKEARKHELEVQRSLDLLEKQIVNDPSKLPDYYKIKLEWESFQNKKAEGIIMRSKAQCVEEGEKNTKYFLNLEKRNFNAKHIKTLILPNGQLESKPENILQEQEKFYKSLYASTVSLDPSTNNFTSNPEIPKLDNMEKEMCDLELTLTEIGQALKDLPNDKTPGNDGFSTNFYKFFWPNIKDLLFKSIKYSFHSGLLSLDQRRGIINIIPKEGKDLRYLRHWRPVRILNTDYKILTKALANRLQKVLPKLINPDQVGYIKGRYIGQNIRIINDIQNSAAISKLPGYIVLVDFEKAFDSVEWCFLIECLKSYNFGNNFIKWMKIFYNNIQSCVGNNGFYSSYFNLTRGIRQGCPISALLFILVAETLAIKIRQEKSLRGIKINNVEIKLCQLADDTTLFLKDNRSISLAFTILKQFERT